MERERAEKMNRKNEGKKVDDNGRKERKKMEERNWWESGVCFVVLFRFHLLSQSFSLSSIHSKSLSHTQVLDWNFERKKLSWRCTLHQKSFLFPKWVHSNVSLSTQFISLNEPTSLNVSLNPILWHTHSISSPSLLPLSLSLFSL